MKIDNFETGFGTLEYNIHLQLMVFEKCHVHIGRFYYDIVFSLHPINEKAVIDGIQIHNTLVKLRSEPLLAYRSW